ncbi:MATE family efflux transporter [Butyrivibrio sp. MC2013]|uniref:MATE family efflux transporter n=1 Tax=Butyrivibrio sp. MC2013 TaxID=1280686 RepID=UPI00041D8292|nr:MATE family efflux transporter [Butyrivibrio sp. MC2013]
MEFIRKLFKPVDMTKGNPAHNIVMFMIPMLIGNVAQQLYSTVDSIIVGKYVGDNALAAVGSATPLLNLFLMLFVGVSVGAGIMVSQAFGAKDREELSIAVGTSIVLTFISSLLIMVLVPPVIMPLLRLMGTPETIIYWANQYLIILFVGVIGSAYYNILGGILRGLGDSISALLYLIIATILNIILDYAFVRYLGLGVAGVALATIIAQLVSGVLSFMKLMKMKELFDLNREYLKPKKEPMLRLIKLGLPSGLTQAIFSFSLLAVQSLTNTFGETYIAANVMVMRVDGFVMMPAFSFGQALTTFTGQNVGAKRMDRVKSGTRQGTIIAIATSLVIAVLIYFGGHPLMSIFTSTEDLVNLAFSMMMILMPGYIAMEVTQCLSGTMRGAGDTMTPMWISLINSVLVRVPMAYFLVNMSKTAALPQGNRLMLQYSLVTTWIIGATLTFLLYLSGIWKRKLPMDLR